MSGGQTWLTMTDDGCSFHPVCLTCPFERCRFDMKPGQVQMLLKQQEAMRLHMEGKSIAEITAALGVDRRSVYRYLKVGSNGRDNNSNGDDNLPDVPG